MDAITAERLQHILECAAPLPGYRDRFWAAGLLEQTADGLALVADWQRAFLRLPPLDRATVRRNPGAFLATATDVVYRGMTSGTQGQALTYFAGTAWNQARLQARHRSLTWWGITDEVPILNVASRLLPLRPGDGAIVGPLTPQLIHHLLTWLALRPTALRGYPSRLCEVATQLSHTRVPPVIAVICTGECLFEQQQAWLEQVFCAPVVNEYGCQESGRWGLTCPEAGRLHLDGGYLDGATASPRCLYEQVNGQWVTTDLLNQVMPMVRYDAGDQLAIDPDPCPCGHQGLTARVLGRATDVIETRQGKQLVGSVAMPAFPHIQHYRLVQHDPSHVRVFVQPSPSLAAVQVEPLVEWMHQTFGEIAVQVMVEQPPVLQSVPVEDCDTPTWMQTVLRGSWATWLQHPALPMGTARPLAELWSEFVNPSVVVNTGFSPHLGRSLQGVLDSPIDGDRQIESIKIRLLLLVCSGLASNTEQALSVYRHTTERLQTFLQDQVLEAEQVARLQLDQLIPSLYLPEAIAAWSAPLPTFPALDGLAVQHLFYALEAAAHRAIAHHRSPLLRPLLAVLLGDLQTFAPQFGGWLLAYWVEWLQGQPLPCAVPGPTGEFVNAWLSWRQTWITEPPWITEPLRAGAIASLAALETAARSPLEQAQVVLERGYDHLLNRQPLDPALWLPRVQTQGKLLGQRVESNRQIQVNPVAWAPILKALAKSLVAIDQRDLAYQCLVAATVPASKVSAFERLAATVNGKQAILGTAHQEPG